MVKNMRLSKIYYELSGFQKKLLLELNASPRNGIKSVKNLHLINDYLHKLEAYAVFEPEIKDLKNAGNCYYVTYPNAEMSDSDYRTYCNAISRINYKLSMLSYLYEITGSKLEDKTLCFSFPNEHNNLNVFKGFTSDISKALNQIANIPNFKGSITFKGVESGSDWLYFTIDGEQLFAAIVLLLPIIKSVVIDSIKTYKVIKEAELISDSNLTLSKIQQKLFKKYFAEETTFNQLSPEDVERLVNSSVQIASQIANGAKTEIALLNEAKSDTEKNIEKALESCVNELKLLAQPPAETDSEANNENDDQNKN